ncbi:tetratricopeptide repeat protein [bacterium]|nr:tetratricopeptide repeat protein [bacterium]
MAESTQQTLDVQTLLLDSIHDIEKSDLLREAHGASVAHRREIESLVIELMENPTIDGESLSETDATLAVGVGLWALGRLEEAIARLATLGTPEGEAFLGQCYLEAGFYSRAAEAFERTSKGCAAVKRFAALGHAEATLKSGNPTAAATAIRAILKGRPDDARAHYLLGYCHDQNGRYEDAVAAYETALEAVPGYPPATFRLGFAYALRGEEDRALEYYESIAAQEVTYANALVNLGVVYEDKRDLQSAIQCYRRVLRANPRHPRARMFLSDAHASLDMVYDEDHQRELDRRAVLLAVPVSDFELSVRVRNCLQRMDIHTLGNLVSHTEEELLASKNFGETSLHEIKEMLAARNLRLGQDREDVEPQEEEDYDEDTGAEMSDVADEAVMNTPISGLDLSLRSRKCMERLGIATIGQLISHNPEELLASRNFGRTSLSEVSEKLGKYGLRLTEPLVDESDEPLDEDDKDYDFDNGQ